MLTERKQKDRQTRRQGIQRAARHVFAERGFAKASIEQIAKESALSVGAIYLYFRSKEDLYASLLEDTLRLLGDELERARAGADLRDRLRATWDVLLAWSVVDGEGTRALRLLAQPAARQQLSAEVAAAIGGGLDRVRNAIASCVSDGVDAGIYRPVVAAEISDVLWATFIGSLDTAEIRANLELSTVNIARAALSLVEGSLRGDGAGVRAAA